MLQETLDWFYHVFIEQWDWIFVLGFFAQAMFMMRFVVQWLASERARKSIIPLTFWFFSLSGGVLLLVYGILRKDPVIILGQGFGLLVYARNLWLIFKERRDDPVM